MAWIESHQSLLDHPKTRRCAAMLGIPRVYVIGHLHALWYWALDNAEDGDVTRAGADLAFIAEYDGDPERFVAALTDCGIGADGVGFLERDGDRLLIHDWHGYAGKLIERRSADRERKAAGRRKDSAGRPADILRTSSGHPADGAESPADGARTPAESIRNRNPNRNHNDIETAVSMSDAREKPPAPENTPHGFCEAFLTMVGTDPSTVAPAWFAENRAHAKHLIEQGITTDRLRAYLEYERSRGRTDLRLRFIRKDILDWEAAGAPAEPIPVESARDRASARRRSTSLDNILAASQRLPKASNA